MISSDDFWLQDGDALDFDIQALDRQLVALALHDAEDVAGRRKGKARIDSGPSDEELAFALCVQELADRELAHSLYAALHDDGDLLAQIEQEERMARRDRELALAAARGVPLPDPVASPVRSPVRSPARSGTSTPRTAASQAPGRQSRFGRPLSGAASGAQTPRDSGRRSTISQHRSISEIIHAPIHIDEVDEDHLGSSSRVECTACGSRIRGGRSLRAPCDHVYDAGCIADLFEASMTDESLFPPRCCRQEIPVDSVRALVPAALLQRFEAKTAELRTLRRVYCANAACARFLGAQADAPAPRTCPACHTTTCAACTAAHAPGAPCTEPDADALLALAREEGWQRCPGCRRVVELEMGCFHMMCRCRTEFCYACAAPWKTCACPQWEEHRLVAVARRQVENEHGRALERQNAPAQHALVQQAVERLRYDHDCRHPHTKFRRGSYYQCENCSWHADQYILECTDCHTRLCKRCRNNRL